MVASGEEASFVHEMSLCEAIAATVAKHSDGLPVTAVVVKIGHFRQVVPDALEFCWGMLTEGTELDGAKLVIEQVPALMSCDDCKVEAILDMPILMCAACGSQNVTLLTGEEFQIVSFDVEEN
ncbi:MAG: hydrogenase nickel incorporation protein HypA/HybF [Actinomycetota bacterium]|nr:hydrogenase nickel incorporation protein HypA/HybF [Actinomycetota bacterium]